MKRVMEPELMEDEAQALAYAQADFEAPNAAYVEQLETRFGPLPADARVVDLGCGPADIALRLARAHPGWRIDAVDGSEAMLRHGRQAAEQRGVADRVRLICDLVPSTRLATHAYDIVLSNSLLHHLPDPGVLWTTVACVGRGGARVLIVDLARPENSEAAAAIVETYSGSEPEVLRRDFYNSLLAAFTVEEVRAQLAVLGMSGLGVEMVSDRHLRVSGCLPDDPEALAQVRSHLAGHSRSES